MAFPVSNTFTACCCCCCDCCCWGCCCCAATFHCNTFFWQLWCKNPIMSKLQKAQNFTTNKWKMPWPVTSKTFEKGFFVFWYAKSGPEYQKFFCIANTSDPANTFQRANIYFFISDKNCHKFFFLEIKLQNLCREKKNEFQKIMSWVTQNEQHRKNHKLLAVL